MNRILIVIPSRAGEINLTNYSLRKQVFTGFSVVNVIDAQQKGANWARNYGFKEWKGEEFVLFSDNDIEWHPLALKIMVKMLEKHPGASYAYGAYTINGGNMMCNVSFDAEKLKQGNYISTMALIRAKDFNGFDETIQRLQDWDLWLTMLENGKTGVYCNTVLFDTYYRRGISSGEVISLEEAIKIVKEKHNLL